MAWDGSLEPSFSNEFENVGAPGWIRTSGLWLRRPRKGDNRGSGKPLPLILLPFCHTSDHPNPPRAATDCQSFVSQLAV